MENIDFINSTKNEIDGITEKTMNESQFDSLTDRLLMYMTGGHDTYGIDAPKESINKLEYERVNNLLRSRKQQFRKIGLTNKHLMALERIIISKEINGKQLVDVVSQCSMQDHSGTGMPQNKI